MTFEEITNLLIAEYENNLEKFHLLDIPFEEKRDFTRLQVALCALDKFDDKVLEYLNNNSLVNSIKEVQKGIYDIKTKFGETKLLTPKTLYQGNMPFVPIIGDCYNNSLTNTLVTSYSQNPAASVGILYISDENHIVHAISEFDNDKDDRYIIDYNYNLVMRKDFYCKLYNFKILNTVTKEQIHELLTLYYNCKEHTLNREDKDNIHNTAYLLLAPDEYKKYAQDIIADQRFDDYKFMFKKVYEKSKEYH